MADIHQPSFWSDASDELNAKTARTLFEIFFRGGAVGARLLPPSLRVLLDWDVFNQAAVDYLRLYKLNTVPGITQTLQEQSVKRIQDWIQSGEPLPALKQRLEPLFGKLRASRIAVTEVTRTYAAGNISAWTATGIVSAKKWQTVFDERVCPICGPLHNKIVVLNENFVLEDIPADWGNPDEFIYYQPPAHVNCRCYLLPVVSREAVSQQRKARLAND